MSGRVLIVEPRVGDRILLRGQLEAAHYEVATVALTAARAEMEACPPDVLLIGLDAQPDGALALCAALRGNPDLALFPIIALAAAPPAALRQAALRAGADDLIDQGLAPTDFLAARMRSLLRADDPTREIALRPDSARALGMAEAVAEFVPAGRTFIVSPRAASLPPPLAALVDRLPGGVTRVTPEQAFAAEGPAGGPSVAADLFVIDAWRAPGAQDSAALPRLLARFAADPRTRRARKIVAVDGAGDEVAALALDLGADDVVSPDMPCEEVMLRVRAQLRRKHHADRRRDHVQTGLEHALHDPLTGLRNRRFAMAELPNMAMRLAAEGLSMAVILLDIDHFKRINDRHGHAAGDAVLREIGRRLMGNLRAVDLAARNGGEEFLVALPGATADQARGVAERLLSLIAATPCLFDDGGMARVTVSAGVAGIGPAESWQAALEEADRALYAAKTAGRNRVFLAPPRAAAAEAPGDLAPDLALGAQG